ncbi:MAG: response regulator [Candidatus Marinimicrobia bacterium]|nr:response regulator [Candidatus Neomarinimicrobiota bacterium]
MHKSKILLVDDEPVTVLAETTRLKKHGFAVQVLNNGQESIQYLKKHDDIDIILMDIELDGELDGIETAKKIHQNHDLPILFLTAHENPELLHRVKTVESYNYLLKDTSGQMIANAIHQALKLHKANQKIREQNKRLRQKEEQYRKIVEGSRDAMAILKNSKLLITNQAFARLMGHNQNKLAGFPIKELLIFDNLEEKLNTIRGKTNKASETFEFEMVNAQDSLRYVRARLIKIEIQLEPAFFLTLYDLTEQKELFKKVEKAKKMTDELGSFIPICASCKKIKDKEGNKDIWIEPEYYISERLPEIKFTHGICPDCREKLYPQYFDASSEQRINQE